jgi:hypothetical protein
MFSNRVLGRPVGAEDNKEKKRDSGGRHRTPQKLLGLLRNSSLVYKLLCTAIGVVTLNSHA